MEKTEWDRLWRAVKVIAHGFEAGVVFIGGIAVAAHTMESEALRGNLVYSHDADMMISTADYMDLRDIEEVTNNRSLSKAQFVKDGFEFDVYVEGRNDLVVPYGEAFASSDIRSGIRVACLEHLLILKLEALASRQGSAKGDKDQDDVLRLLVLLAEAKPRVALLERLAEERRPLLSRVLRSDAVRRMSQGNDHKAKSLRADAQRAVQSLSPSLPGVSNEWDDEGCRP